MGESITEFDTFGPPDTSPNDIGSEINQLPLNDPKLSQWKTKRKPLSGGQLGEFYIGIDACDKK